jgi:translation initiation factor IF-1
MGKSKVALHVEEGEVVHAFADGISFKVRLDSDREILAFILGHSLIRRKQRRPSVGDRVNVEVPEYGNRGRIIDR